LFIPCGRLSWLPVSFLLHVKYTLSYRIVYHIVKCPPPERTHALSRTRYGSMDASMTSCSMLLQTYSRHWRSSSTFRIFV